jgi:tetratricopeptide (TPR) repeat protein
LIEGYYGKGTALRYLGRLEEALQIYEHGVELDN